MLGRSNAHYMESQENPHCVGVGSISLLKYVLVLEQAYNDFQNKNNNFVGPLQ